MFHSAELEIIHWIHEFRGPLLDGFFTFLDFFDRQEFVFILIPAAWLCLGWKWGMRLYYILFLNSLVNYSLKEFFHSPRPFHLDPALGVIQVGGYGFPSGAAQLVILLSGLLISYWKSFWKWPLAFVYIAMVSFSRVYMGIHFPTDIVAGWVVGFALWALFMSVRPLIEVQLERCTPLTLFLISQLIPVSLLYWQFSPSFLHASAYSMGIGAMGLGLGVFLNYSCGWSLDPPKTTREYALRAAIGIIGTFLSYYLISLFPLTKTPLSLFFKYLFVSLWITSGSLLVSRQLIGNKLEPGRA